MDLHDLFEYLSCLGVAAAVPLVIWGRFIVDYLSEVDSHYLPPKKKIFGVDCLVALSIVCNLIVLADGYEQVGHYSRMRVLWVVLIFVVWTLSFVVRYIASKVARLKADA